MKSLSVKGVVRKYAGITGNISLRQIVWLPGLPPLTRPGSVAQRLLGLARETHSFDVSECIYGWTAAFDQTWTHIVVRIRLDFAAGITATPAALEARWRKGIEDIWNNKWGCGRQGIVSCPLIFTVFWVTSNEHHIVNVTNCPPPPLACIANISNWYTPDPGSTAAHEYGHMLGNVDEYERKNVCPNRSPVNTGTVMDHNANNVPARMMQRFANNIGCNVVNI